MLYILDPLIDCTKWFIWSNSSVAHDRLLEERYSLLSKYVVFFNLSIWLLLMLFVLQNVNIGKTWDCRVSKVILVLTGLRMYSLTKNWIAKNKATLLATMVNIHKIFVGGNWFEEFVRSHGLTYYSWILPISVLCFYSLCWWVVKPFLSNMFNNIRTSMNVLLNTILFATSYRITTANSNLKFRIAKNILNYLSFCIVSYTVGNLSNRFFMYHLYV